MQKFRCFLSDTNYENKLSPVLIASRNGDLDLVKYLLTKELSLEVKYYGKGVLDYACQSGDISLISFIILNTDIEKNDKEQKRLIEFVIKKQTQELTHYFKKLNIKSIYDIKYDIKKEFMRYFSSIIDKDLSFLKNIKFNEYNIYDVIEKKYHLFAPDYSKKINYN
ncbi:MAG: ankyrin repeat domain-containing protein [Bacteroidetes bacterium]|nr:ankyrin repeat domain-containing protein [Bacteroidota bacterium]